MYTKWHHNHPLVINKDIEPSNDLDLSNFVSFDSSLILYILFLKYK